MRRSPNTSRRSHSRTTRAAAAGVAAVLGTGLLAACSSDDSGGGTASNGKENVTLSIGVFGEFGFEEAGLYDQYMKENPHVTIDQTSTSERDDYYAQLLTRLPTGSGLMDIQAVEVDNIYEQANQQSQFWVDFNEYDVDLDHFADWKTAQATNEDGQTIGLGTDIGPTAVCYRADLFEEAGLPTDPDEVAELWAGGWEDYISVGEEFLANSPSDIAFTDSAEGIFNVVLHSFAEQMYDASGEVIYQESEAVETAWDLSVEAAEAGLSARLEQFKPEWEQAIANGDFASLVCPAWMLGNLQANGGDAGEGLWQVTSAPAPSNWGGSFIGVTDASSNKDEAVKLAAWLTAPEQQATLFTERGSFPSSVEAQELPAVSEATHPYFEDTPIGEIFSDAAQGIPTSVVGPRDQTIREGLNDGLVKIESQGVAPDDAWDDAVRSIENALDQ